MPGTRYSPEQQAEAIAVGMAKGAIEAAEITGVNRRTISRWLASTDTHSAVVTAAVLATEEAIAARLWDTFTIGLEEVRRGLLDPHARLGDKARATEVIAAQWQLLTGRVTSRTESANLNVNVESALTPAERVELEAYLRQTIATYEADHPEETS